MATEPLAARIEVLNDGSRALIRGIEPGDVARNAAFIEALSPPSKHFLFLGGISKMTGEQLRRLCDPREGRDMAFVALDADTGRQIGVCRYAGAEPEHGAEISIAVADAWQRRGLGRRLLQALIDHARAHGIGRLYSMDAADNASMRTLARRFGFTERPDPDDVHQVMYSLDL
jgi:RimJ/RimL family protein N-acetyltransferase